MTSRSRWRTGVFAAAMMWRLTSPALAADALPKARSGDGALVGVGTAYTHGIDVNDRIRSVDARVTADWRLAAAFGLGLELSFVRFAGSRSGADAGAAGVRLLPNVAWHFLRIGRSSLLFDFGFGGAVFAREFPPQGTRLNGYSAVGLGARIALDRQLTAMLGVRLVHHSNGRGLVTDNPAFDGLSVAAGIGWSP